MECAIVQLHHELAVRVCSISSRDSEVSQAIFVDCGSAAKLSDIVYEELVVFILHKIPVKYK